MSGEDAFIARHFASWAGRGGLGLRDDAALIAPPPGCDLVATTDAIVAGVHFLPDDAPADIARKALRVNLSDLAAKGAGPLGFLLTLAIPRDGFGGMRDDAFLADFAQALREDSAHYGCALLGGDTVATPGPLMVSITALGSVPAGCMVRRDGAQAGDRLYVTGTIGDAALGLLVLRHDPRLRTLSAAHRDHLIDRYRRPQPRLALATALREHATAAMDVSDGLAGDLTKMLSLAGLSASIALTGLPLSGAARAACDMDPALYETILSGGDDYEIISAIPADLCASFEAAARDANILVTSPGFAAAGVAGVMFHSEDGRALPLDRLAYSHV